MAEILSQGEIDRLFKLINSDEGGESEEETEKSSGSIVITDKVFSANSTKHYYEPVHFSYKSPVVKSHQILFDPESHSPVPPGKVVVRSLANYNKYYKSDN